jgi:hypothetical protein
MLTNMCQQVFTKSLAQWSTQNWRCKSKPTHGSGWILSDPFYGTGKIDLIPPTAVGGSLKSCLRKCVMIVARAERARGLSG